MLSEIILSSIVFILIDSIYLTSISNYFNNQMISIQGTPLKMNYGGAIVSYIFLILGLYYFVLREKKPVKDAFILGLVIYMVYEGTNKAIITNWKWKTVIIDGLWGGILYALTTYLTYRFINYFV